MVSKHVLLGYSTSALERKQMTVLIHVGIIQSGKRKARVLFQPETALRQMSSNAKKLLKTLIGEV